MSDLTVLIKAIARRPIRVGDMLSVVEIDKASSIAYFEPTTQETATQIIAVALSDVDTGQEIAYQLITQSLQWIMVPGGIIEIGE
jgi:hypothetical protein